jgi:hypothetical protein
MAPSSPLVVKMVGMERRQLSWQRGEKQYAYCAAFRDLATRFIGAIKRIGDPDLLTLVAELDTSFEGEVVNAHELRANLYTAIDALREAMQDPTYEATAAANGAFISPEVLLWSSPGFVDSSHATLRATLALI